MIRAVIVSGAAVVAVSCMKNPPAAQGPVRSQAAAVACAPTTGDLQSGATIGMLRGNYRVVMVATSGAHMGKRTEGSMQFFTGPNSATLAGTSTVIIDSVGAVAPGQWNFLTATIWEKPLVSSTVPAVTIRFGQSATSGGATAIEGSYTAIQLTSLTADKFTGTWSSGEGGKVTEIAGGYICGEKR
jgi:hypothetical protein